MTIMIPSELEDRLKAEAVRRGVSTDQVAREIIAEHLPAARKEDRRSLSELFARWAAEDATDDAAELARRSEETEQFMCNLARNRKAMEGPDSRDLWPCRE